MYIGIITLFDCKNIGMYIISEYLPTYIRIQDKNEIRAFSGPRHLHVSRM